jgi:hypothetical protein
MTMIHSSTAAAVRAHLCNYIYLHYCNYFSICTIAQGESVNEEFKLLSKLNNEKI